MLNITIFFKITNYLPNETNKKTTVYNAEIHFYYIFITNRTILKKKCVVVTCYFQANGFCLMQVQF